MTPYYRDGDRWIDADVPELAELPLLAFAALAVLELIDSFRRPR